MNLLLVLIGSLALFWSQVQGKENVQTVPVLMFNTHRVPVNLPAGFALQQIPYSSFQANYLSSFSPDNVLLFLQDQLSIEDLSSHPVELDHIATLMEDKHAVYLPSVVDASFLEHDLPTNHGYNVIHIVPGSGIGGVNLKKNEKNLVVVKIPSTSTNPSISRALQKADEVMSEVMSKIGKLADFTVVYTGKEQRGYDKAKSVEHVRISRSLQQIISDVPENLKGFYLTKCVLFYAKNNMTLFSRESNKTIVLSTRADSVLADCQEKKNTLKLIWNDVENSKLHIEYNFAIMGGGKWVLENATVFTDSNPNDATLYPSHRMETVPLKKSYSCTQLITLRSNASSTNETKYELHIKGLQVEAFTNNRTKFSDSWDCVGFFTIPIWMGILTSILFTMILAVGLYMLAEVKTMDRFDDPKGKHVFMQANISD